MTRTRIDDHYDRRLEYWRRFEAEKQALYRKNIIHGCFIAVAILFGWIPIVLVFSKFVR
jgi:hypothetical protein